MKPLLMCVLNDNETWTGLDGCTVRVWNERSEVNVKLDGDANGICDEVQPDHFIDLMEPNDLRQLADMLDKLYAEDNR